MLQIEVKDNLIIVWNLIDRNFQLVKSFESLKI